MLVEAFRKRNAELRKERTPYQSTLFSLWELLLQEVEAESHSHGEVSRFLSRTLGSGLLEKTFHRKLQARKAFLHRESVEAILAKANEALETVSRLFPLHHLLLLSRMRGKELAPTTAVVVAALAVPVALPYPRDPSDSQAALRFPRLTTRHSCLES